MEKNFGQVFELLSNNLQSTNIIDVQNHQIQNHSNISGDEDKEIQLLKDQLATMQTVHDSCTNRIGLMKNLLDKFKFELGNSSKALKFSQSQLTEAKQRNQTLQMELESLKLMS